MGLGSLLPVAGFSYLRLNPALAPALWGELTQAQRHAARATWAAAMRELVVFLYEQRFKNSYLASRLTLLDLPNLVAALVWYFEAAKAGHATPPKDNPEQREATPSFDNVTAIATSLESLLQFLGRPRGLALVARLRADAAQHLGAWSHVRFDAERAGVERLLDAGRSAEAVVAAQRLLQQAQTTGPTAYTGAAYDLALAHFMLGRMLTRSGNAEAALVPMAEAHTRFTALADAGNASAARMASGCLTESADSLRALGRLEEAAEVYETAIELAEHRGEPRNVAVNKGQLGTVRLLQGNYLAALAAWTAARDTFAQLNEPASIAVAWHQIGWAHQEAGQYEAAEHAYQESLRIEMQMGNAAGQATTLDQLGRLYNAMGRLEDAVRFHLQAAEIQDALHDLAAEGRSRGNAATCLVTLRRYDDARRELQRAFACKPPFGHAAEPWKTFDILSDLERAVGNASAAAEARQQAMDAYLAYRRAGGVSQSPLAEQYSLVAQALTTHQPNDAATTLTELAERPNLPDSAKPAIAAFQAILAGSRDPALADDPHLHYRDAAELRLLLEQLGPA